MTNRKDTSAAAAKPLGVWIDELKADRDQLQTRAERAEEALTVYGNKVEEYASDCPVMSDAAYDWLNKDAGKTARAALAQTDAEPANLGRLQDQVSVCAKIVADAYRAGLEAAADELMVEALACEGNFSVETAQKAIRAQTDAEPEFGGEPMSNSDDLLADGFRLGTNPTDDDVSRANWIIDRQSARIEELENKLAKAVEALDHEIKRSRRHLAASTLATLAELKGQDR